VRLNLIGEGWKLVAFDIADEERETEALRRIEEHLARRPLLGAPLQLQRMTKRRVCEGALRVRTGDGPPEHALELQGVDVGSSDGLRQRWFGVADPRAAAEPDLMVHREDAWWREFAGGTESLLRVEQWFSGRPDASPFQTALAGGNLAFDGRRSVLKQWLDVSGPSLVALRIRQALQPRPAATATVNGSTVVVTVARRIDPGRPRAISTSLARLMITRWPVRAGLFAAGIVYVPVSGTCTE